MICLHACLCTLCVQCSLASEARRAHLIILALEGERVCKLPICKLGINPSPLEEQPAFSAAELLLQPHFSVFLTVLYGFEERAKQALMGAGGEVE